MRLITLTTDFGVTDWFVGTMKGVILRINPRARIVDITHGIPSGDVWAGALALMASVRFFPKGTIHLAVVDPGVGSPRHALLIETRDSFFIGPDNGLLSLALTDEKILRIHQLKNPSFFLHPISQTFHGRDIFAPSAAHLSKGVSPQNFGPAQSDYVRLERRAPTLENGRITGEILYIDRFGNALTNITLGHLGDIDPAKIRIAAGRRRALPLSRYYQAVPPGKPVGIISSTDFLEISINGGNAAALMKLKVGDCVVVTSV